MSRKPPAIGERNMNLLRVVYYVTVGKNEAVRSEDEPGASALALTFFPGASAGRLRYINFCHRWANPFRRGNNRIGVGIEQSGVAVGRRCRRLRNAFPKA